MNHSAVMQQNNTFLTQYCRPLPCFGGNPRKSHFIVQIFLTSMTVSYRSHMLGSGLSNTVWAVFWKESTTSRKLSGCEMNVIISQQVKEN